MNVSRAEQKTLHALAQGGRILIQRGPDGLIVAADCITRDGWRLSNCDLALWRKLKRRRLVASHDGRPYAITRFGLEVLRPQLDNRIAARR